MKLAISNIAWDREEDKLVIAVLNKLKVEAIEVAPTKFWDRPVEIDVVQIQRERMKWESQQIRLVAMQSLLFGQSHMSMFESEQSREEMLDYLAKIIQLAGVLGVKNLVFGSPKNRLAGSLSKKEQLNIAVPFFEKLGELSAENRVCFCIEPNPVQYGCDFITNSREGIELIKQVNHPGFRLHLDAGTLALNQEEVSTVIEDALPHLAHFHISEPFLDKVGSPSVIHERLANALKGAGYSEWVSIEMKNGSADQGNVKSVEKALNYAAETYLS